ncbi:hypothetical protein K469DRAFT_753183 [Zopfia rhizophila CBS 207.26]|uniref:Uncharacterized protein n=1 Tax=Zopfia rhizophila CBS 207.26 TaxID=1314779 RepID=A0A6A6DR83_9PEZI|nr:hypothetical protein K469DRAFT_753183 [Zopfia rhizophila CBS 207.26]
MLQEYFNAHPKAKKFKSRPLEFKEQHRQLFEGVLATGQDALLINNIITNDFKPAQSVERDSSVNTSQAIEEDSDVKQKPSPNDMPPKSTSTKRKRAAESQSDTQFTFKQELRDIAAENLVPPAASVNAPTSDGNPPTKEDIENNSLYEDNFDGIDWSQLLEFIKPLTTLK